jgi:hypothetical protein
MTVPQERTLSMLEAVVLLLDNNTTKTATLPNYVNIFTVFKGTVNDIKLIQGKQRNIQNSTQGTSKADARVEVTLRTRKLINALKAYFEDVQNTTNATMLSVKPSYFDQMADTNLVSDCRSFYNLGMTVKIPLEDYGIAATWLPAYKAAIDTFENIVPVPRITRTEQAGYTADLVKLFATAKEQLDKISNKIALLEFDDVSFYNQFQTVKKVVLAKGKALAFKASILEVNNVTLKRFTISLVRQADNKAFEYKTNDNNTLQRRNLTEGVYTIAIKALDVPAFTGRVVLDAGTTCAIRAEVDIVTKTILRVVKTDTGEEL